MSYNPKSLSAVFQISTTAPFPILKDTATDPNDLFEKSTADLVTLNVCSEFTQRTAPVTAFETTSKLAYCVDAAGQPVLASIGLDNRLYLVCHVSGCPQAWQLQDISPGPSNSVIVAFDFVSFAAKLYIVAAVKLSNSASQLYSCSLNNFTLAYDDDKRMIQPDLKSRIAWRAIQNSLGDKVVSSLKIGPADPTQSALTTSADYQISVGTQSTDALSGAHYVVDPSENASSPWRLIPMPETTHRVLETDSANTFSGVGTFILYDRGDGVGCTQEVLDNSGRWQQPLGNIRLLTAILGTAKSMSTLHNIEGKTDVFIAGDKGVGFFDARNLTKTPPVILPSISFKQAIASEDVDPQNSETRSIITVFAVSEDGGLYFVRGIRTWADNKITFESSGLPIRTGLWALSCAFNPFTGSHELIYSINGAANLRHLVKDMQTGAWNETTICVPSTGKFRSYPAYTASITCTNASKQPVPQGYPLAITSESIQAIINDKTYNLSAAPTTVPTDANGRIQIFVAVDDALGAPAITVGLSKFLTAPQTFPISLNQRVVRALASMQKQEDIINSKDSLGKPVFPSLKNDDGKVAGCAGMLQKFPAMINHVDSGAAQQLLPPSSNTRGDASVTVEKGDDGQYHLTGCDWFDQALHKAEKFVHDVIEWLKGAAKKVLRIGFRILDAVLEFAVEVAGRIVKIVIKTVGTLVRSLVNFLKDALGIDLTGLLNWLGFIFDVDEIKKTQKVLTDFINGGIKTSLRFLKINRSTVTDGIEHIRALIKPFIKDSRPPPQPANPNSKENPISKILHSPLVHMLLKLNPIEAFVNLVLETAEEEMGDVFKIPSVADFIAIFREDIPALLEDEVANLKRLFDDIFSKIKNFMSEPRKCGEILLEVLGDIFWTAFDAIASLLVHGFDIVIRLVSQIFHLLRDTIKIPFLTTIFEVAAEQDFSIINCATFIVAGIMNIVYAVKDQKLPFQVLGDPSWIWSHVTDDMLDLHPLLGGLGMENSTKPQRLMMTANVSTESKQVPVRSEVNGRALSSKNTIRAMATTTEAERTYTDQENEDYETVKGWYEKCEWIPDVISNFSLVANSDLVILIATKIRKEPETDAAGHLPLATLIPDFCAAGTIILARLSDFILWAIANKESKRFEDEYGWRTNQAMFAGLIVPLVFTFPSVLPNLVSKDKVGRNITLVALALLDIPYQACCVMAQHASGRRLTSSIMRTIGDAAGAVSVVTDAISGKEKTTPQVVVIGVGGGIATAMSVTSFIVDLTAINNP